MPTTEAEKHYSDYRAGAFRRNLALRIDHIWDSRVGADAAREPG